MTNNLPTNKILMGNALTVLSKLPSASVDLVFTSPPYFNLRNYGIGAASGEIGNEFHVENWVQALFKICEQAKRVLTPTGSLWLNLGDSYSYRLTSGAARKSLLLAPERLALQLTKSGWLLRNKVIWNKCNHLPSSILDRLTGAWEYLYFFTKQPRYYFNLDAIREPHLTMPRRALVAASSSQSDGKDNSSAVALHSLKHLKLSGRVGHPAGKNPGDVWRLSTSHYGGSHRATMPVELAKQAIMAACPELRCSVCKRPYIRDNKQVRAQALKLGQTALKTTELLEQVALRPTCHCHAKPEPGVVLDPFFGSGTTAVAAEELKRNWLGIELNPQYVPLAQQRIMQSRPRRGR